MIDPRSVAINFEAKKVALQQSKDGIMLKLSIHPSDMKEALWQHHIGARYQVVVVEIGDDEQPKVTEPQPEAPAERATARKTVKQAWSEMKLSARAGIMCNDPAFWNWAASRENNGFGNVVNAQHAADWLRNRTSVGTRKAYDTDSAAGQRYLSIERAFYESREREQRP